MDIISRNKRSIICAAGIVLAALGLCFFRELVFEALRLVIIAGILAILLCPLCRLYEKHMPSGAAAALCLLTAILAVLAALSAVVFPLASVFSGFYNSIPDTAELLKGMLPSGIPLLKTIMSKIEYPDLSQYVIPVFDKAITGAVNLAGTAADIAVAAVLAWYMLIDRENLTLRIELLIPFRFRSLVLRNASEAQLEIMMYLRGQSIIAVCVGLLSALGLFIIGIDNAIPLGLTAGILNMIPYLGPVLSCIPVGAVAITQGIVPLLLAAGVLIAVQQIDGLILSPRIVGSSTGFAPALVMVAVFAFGAVWGIVGMLIALPVMILIRTCVRVFVELSHNY